MKLELFNPMINKKAKEIMVISFIGLLALNLLITFFSGSVKDDFVFRNSSYTLGLLVLSYYFIFKGYGPFRYFAVVYGVLNFVLLYILTLIPKGSDGMVDINGMNWINDLDRCSKIWIYIGFMLLQIVFIGLLFKPRSIALYMIEAEKERKGIIVKE